MCGALSATTPRRANWGCYASGREPERHALARSAVRFGIEQRLRRAAVHRNNFDVFVASPVKSAFFITQTDPSKSFSLSDRLCLIPIGWRNFACSGRVTGAKENVALLENTVENNRRHVDGVVSGSLRVNSRGRSGAHVGVAKRDGLAHSHVTCSRSALPLGAKVDRTCAL